MILTDQRILEEIQKGTIVISPFDPACLGSNSYDVHLGKTLALYVDDVLDARLHNRVEYLEIPGDGLILTPHRFYLGVTQEYTETHAHVPFLEGKSSIGRLGIDIHATAGKGDIGFCNTWTLEISVKLPVRVYAGMPIGQLIYFEISGQLATPYARKVSAKYKERTDKPVESMMWKNFQRPPEETRK
jgi:dCTP deaminase